MSNFKSIFLEKFEEEIIARKIKSILDLGSGLSKNFIPLLEKYPDLEYVGVEPSKDAADNARKSLSRFKNVRIHNASGYDPVEGEKWREFDLVVSLSVLEHVKQLERFIKNSVEAARSGGMIVHRWDLGHALYPSSSKERLQVFLGNNIPSVLPEHKFVRMLGPGEVEGILKDNRANVERITYHQMQGHKKLVQALDTEGAPESEKLLRELIEWEFNISPHLDSIPEEKRLKLFPTVCIWAKKK